ncbi:hypothetical protein SEVIR_2G196100v4 [Setaria viridis]|uniref:Senescence domain-containing protein n=1 Tax=Setaria viridis TaxID=4556 RepID=A0A4U6VXW5_SETVI|nr:uncharacterized protein LOC117846064 [Setaria viridis]TKW32878.1 hypothetical protein SEVIR_2G196100v2 [Setaria viridis]TKW32879.1 hypothetical protein SEVIR_2G196100v2 [Setaria viridis]
MASREGGGGGAAAGRPALRVGRTQEYRTGMDTELLSIDGGGAGPAVSLFVLCGDRFEAAQLFRSGALSLHMLRVEGHPVSMASCTVGDHQWMLARDALVARVDARAFVFELPGFFYAVVVPADAAAGGADRKCATMAEIFSRFCNYHDLTKAEGDDDEAGEVNQNPWARAHARIQRLKRHTSPPGGHVAADAQSDRARQMERAVRTSAVVKLLIRSLLAGVIQPARHLTITLGGGSGSVVNAGSSARASAAALPSKSVVSELLDAIETNRAAPRRDARRGSAGGGLVGWWSLNVEGIMLLLRFVHAVRGRKHLAAPAAGEKWPRDEGPGRDAMRGGVLGGGGAAAFGGGAARRWCGGRSRKLGNTVGACGSS